MATTSDIIDTTDIVSSDVTKIRIDDGFKTSYGLGDLDMKILATAVQCDSGQTDFQSRHFVARSQITPYKQVKQALMELEVRYHAYQEIRASLRKAEIMRQKWQRQQVTMDDDLDRELIQIDIDKNDYDITVWKRKLRQAEYEINSFLTIVKEHAHTPEEVERYRLRDEDEERRYWIARMGKQAAMDIIGYGRVGSGNMDSIAMMDPADQLAALSTAIEYSGLVNAGLAKLSEAAQDKVKALLAQAQPSIPEIMDLMDDAHLQLTSESKAKPETI
jgi:hypothetical protein